MHKLSQPRLYITGQVQNLKCVNYVKLTLQKKPPKKNTFELIETTIQKFEFGSIVMKEVYHSHKSCIF